MLTIILSLFSSARQAFQTRAALQAEILALRHQLLVLQRSSRGHRLPLSRADRFLWVWLAHPILKKMGREKCGFHIFRRFRASWLRGNRVPWDLEKIWMGHAHKDLTDQYAEQ